MSKETKNKLPKLKGGGTFVGTKHALMRYQFIETLFRISLSIEKVYSKRKDLEDTLTVASIFETLVVQHLLEFGHKSSGDTFRTTFIYESKSDGLLREHLLELKTIFKKLNKRNNTVSRNGMARIDFLDFCYNCFSKLVDDSPKNSSTLSNGLTVAKLTQIFIDCKVLETDEIATVDSLDFMDFLESLCRIADSRVNFHLNNIVDMNMKEHKQAHNEEHDFTGNRRGSWANVKQFVKDREMLIEKNGMFAKLEQTKVLKHVLKRRNSTVDIPSLESQLKDEEIQEALDNPMVGQKNNDNEKQNGESIDTEEGDQGGNAADEENDGEETKNKPAETPQVTGVLQKLETKESPDTSIVLLWDNIPVGDENLPNESIILHALEYKEFGAKHWLLASDTIDATEYVVENLNPNTKYEFRVKAIISNKEGEFSDVITAKTSDRSDHGLHESDFHINLRWVINRVCKRYHD